MIFLPGIKYETDIITNDDHLKYRDLLKRFILEQDVNQNSKSNYERVLHQFGKWIKSTNKNFRTLSRVDIIEYKTHLLSAGYSDLTVSSYLSGVRRLFEWLESHKIYPNIAKAVKSPRRQNKIRKQPLTINQCHLLLQAASNRGPRDLAIVSMLLGCGLRTIELIRANISDISVQSGKSILKVQGKGHTMKDDFVKIPSSTIDALKKYLQQRGKVKSNEPLFTSISNSNFGNRLTTRYISMIVKECLKSIGLNDASYSAHCLRHSAATYILKSGLSITDAQHSLRHVSSTTTQIYTAYIKDELRLSDNTELILNNLVCHENSIYQGSDGG